MLRLNCTALSQSESSNSISSSMSQGSHEIAKGMRVISAFSARNQFSYGFVHNENFVFISTYFVFLLHTLPLTSLLSYLIKDATDPSETTSGPSRKGEEADPNKTMAEILPEFSKVFKLHSHNSLKARSVKRKLFRT